MQTSEDIHQKLAYIHQNLKGKYLQWHNPLRREDYSKVVLINDIVEKNGKIMLLFDNGTSLDYELLNNHLVVVDDPSNPPLERINMKPMSLKEIDSAEKNNELITPQNNNTQQSIQKEKVDMFDLLETNEIDLELKIKVKLPDLTLLKLMYNSTKDKEKFLSSIISRIIKNVNEKTIKKSVEDILNK